MNNPQVIEGILVKQGFFEDEEFVVVDRLPEAVSEESQASSDARAFSTYPTDLHEAVNVHFLERDLASWQGKKVRITIEELL